MTSVRDGVSGMVLDMAPEAVAQRQLDAYNARDLDAWLATYATDAQQFEYPATLLASGHAEIVARAARFQEPDLHARLLRACSMSPCGPRRELFARRSRKNEGMYVGTRPSDDAGTGANRPGPSGCSAVAAMRFTPFSVQRTI